MTVSPDALSDAISAVFGSADNAARLEISDSLGVIRVYLGSLGNGDYGLKVISSDGSTVIIDGTSDVFKIAASGTLSASAAANNIGSSNVSLSGLGALAATLMTVAMVGDSTLSANLRSLAAWWAFDGAAWVANTSGGATTKRDMALVSAAIVFANLDGSNFELVTLQIYNYGNTSAVNNYARYYVLQEAAL